MLQTADYILGLQAFLAAFPLHQNFTVDVAKTVLDDAVDYNGLVISEWRTTLLRIGEVEGASGGASFFWFGSHSPLMSSSLSPSDQPELRDLLINFDLPPSFTTASAFLSALVSNPVLFLAPALPSPPATPQPACAALDIVRRSRLPSSGHFRQCTRCGDRTEKRATLGTETGKWSAYELGWDARCMCGGLWLGQVC
jgi:hypothetical protein